MHPLYTLHAHIFVSFRNSHDEYTPQHVLTPVTSIVSMQAELCTSTYTAWLTVVVKSLTSSLAQLPHTKDTTVQHRPP